MVNDEDLSRLCGDAQGNYRRALVRTRYQIDEHGELGAVLVPSDGAGLGLAEAHKRFGKSS